MNKQAFRTLLARITLALPLVGIVACGPTHTELCETAATCGGGRDPEIEACIVEMDAREEQAELFSCEKEFDKHIDCLDANGRCVEERLAGCDASRDALNECIGRRRSGHASIELRSAE